MRRCPCPSFSRNALALDQNRQRSKSSLLRRIIRYRRASVPGTSTSRRRKGEESMLSTRVRVAWGWRGPIARQEAVVPSSGLSWLADAALAALLALGLVQSASAQSPGTLVIQYAGTLKKINDSGVIRIGYRENSPPFAFLDAQTQSLRAIRSTCAKSSSRRLPAELGKDIRTSTRPVTPENRFDLVTFRRRRSRMRLDDEQHRASQDRGVFADHVRHRHQAAGAARQRHPSICATSPARRSC